MTHLIPIGDVKVALNSQQFTRRLNDCIKNGGTAGDISNLISEHLDKSFPEPKKG